MLDPSDILLSHLETAVLAPWLVHGLDARYGGFMTQLNRHWIPYGEAKFLTTQTHLVASFAMAHRAGLGGGCYLDAAQQGAAFLLEHFHDGVHGGWYWAATRDGAPLQRQKRLRGHLSAITALVALYRANGDASLLRAAVETYDLLEDRAYDAGHGGYHEFFTPEWTLCKRDKTLGAHLVALEAVSALAEATDESRYQARAGELVALLTGPMLDLESGHILEHFTADWLPVDYTVHYGHQLDAAWHLAWAADALADPTHRHSALARLDCCIDAAWDDEHGGFAYRGDIYLGAGDVRKAAWVQASGLAALARVSGFAPYYEALFRRQADWCLTRQYDPEAGGWFSACEADGAPHDDDKGIIWHTAYEITQALLAASEDLQVGERA
ncbi:MAG: AGE family epimerase/isomerase [Anaerolineae bacterium]|nr:AGE family epimerase/isomerase [Anaerolineae bacterium]